MLKYLIFIAVVLAAILVAIGSPPYDSSIIQLCYFIVCMFAGVGVMHVHDLLKEWEKKKEKEDNELD